MQVSVEATTSIERRLTVTVPSEQIDSAVDKKVNETAKTIRIDGFRPGKVPTKVVKKRYGASIRQDVLGDVIQSSYFEALQQENIKPAGMPTIEPKEDNGGEDSFSLVPAFEGKGMTERKTLISHSIGGSFSIRQGDWKLCLSAGSGGWSAPREPDAKKKGLPPVQLFNLGLDKAEQKNLVDENPGKAR